MSAATDDSITHNLTQLACIKLQQVLYSLASCIEVRDFITLENLGTEELQIEIWSCHLTTLCNCFKQIKIMLYQNELEAKQIKMELTVSVTSAFFCM